MPKLTINDIEIDVAPGTSVLQACEMIGEEIPRFCYHDRLSVPANCRMCLVEVEKSPKPVASCAMACGEGMVVRTNTETVHKARRGVMEMMLINHPLDCPICDQGGECDLQDQAVAYGFDRSRYEEPKRAVVDKDLGPVIKTVMTRCINCTRCIRFAEEVAGIYDLGQLHRGEDAEITTMIKKSIGSELSGNLVDVCPVGALTSKPYAFKARPWELRKTHSIDVLDAVGSNIRVDARGGEVMRILPRLNENVNEEWISDKTRLAYDGLLKNRLDRPYVRKNGNLEAVEWAQAVTAAGQKLCEHESLYALLGDQMDMDATYALKALMNVLGGGYECRMDGTDLPLEAPHLWRMNTPIRDLETCDALFLIGCTPRHEAAMVNARFTKAYNARAMKAYSYGTVASSTFPIKDVNSIQDGFAMIKDAKNPVVMIGVSALTKNNGGQDLLRACAALAQQHGVVRDDWNGFNVLQRAASRLGSLHLGFNRGSFEEFLNAKVIYACGVDDNVADHIPAGAFLIYQGTHGGKMAQRADIILPGAAYTEKTALYMNCEGRVQQGYMAVHPPGLAKEDWKIIRAISEAAGVTLPFDTHDQLRAAMPHYVIDMIEPAPWQSVDGDTQFNAPRPDAEAFNFYQSCAITRNSATMQACTLAFAEAQDREAA